ncbi:phosphate regulon sensor histidine kinase PhoR [Psychrobacter raelei]|uniref:phosphate regulon sensor histidine kinase PhoR n=1 Tax=Psychrobacter raelei TaxID=2565531 RepID=UPI003F62942E
MSQSKSQSNSASKLGRQSDMPHQQQLEVGAAVSEQVTVSEENKERLIDGFDGATTATPLKKVTKSSPYKNPYSNLYQNLSDTNSKNIIEPLPDNKNPRATLLWSDFKWLVILILLGALLGHYMNALPWGIIVALVLYYVWRLYSVQQFYGWMSKSLTLPPPELSGSMTFMANQLYESKRQEQMTHQRMMGLIKKIRSSLLALQDAVILLDKDDSLEWWNQAAETLLALRSQDQGRSILDLIDAPEFKVYYVDAVSPNDGLRMRSWRDYERFLQCEVTHFGTEKLLIIYDVTRLHHLEQMRKDFVGNVSHELRTPLTVIMGYIETFSDQPDLDPKWRRGFSLMTQQTIRMNQIINDLLLLSRLENEESIQSERVDMPKLLTRIFDDAQAYNKDYNHLIDLHLDSQQDIYGAEGYLHSALLNLVTNAIKYTPKGGEVRITWQEVKEGCLFTVSDNGIGIADEHLDRLTERFYRVDGGRSRSTGGTGLGLAIVKHVLYQHEAKLTIESVEGKGSKFHVLFPRRRIYQRVSSKSAAKLKPPVTDNNNVQDLQDKHSSNS